MEKRIFDLICHDILDFIYDEDTINQKLTMEEKCNLISFFKQTFHNNRKKEQEENEELISEYNLFIGEIQELIDFLHIHHSELEKALILEYLLYKKYLTINRIKKKDTYTLSYHSGINIVAGQGVCRHAANFFQNVNLSNHHGLLAGFVTKGNPLDIHQATNHLINLVYYHDTLYGFDLINRTLWTFVNGYQLTDIQRKNLYLTYRSFNDLTRTNLSISDIKEQLNLYQEASRKQLLTKKEYQELKCHIIEEMNKRKKTLDSFYNDNKSLIKDISNKVLQKRIN